jgi:hypothetical protein
MCFGSREPEHGVRVCSAALRADMPAFLERMAAAGVEISDSRLLPGEFVRVSGGLQQLLARTVVTLAECQVRAHAGQWGLPENALPIWRLLYPNAKPYCICAYMEIRLDCVDCERLG